MFARRPFEEPLQREVPLGPTIEKQVSQAECFHADSAPQHLQFTCNIFPYNLRDGWDTSATCGWERPPLPPEPSHKLSLLIRAGLTGVLFRFTFNVNMWS